MVDEVVMGTEIGLWPGSRSQGRCVDMQRESLFSSNSSFQKRSGRRGKNDTFRKSASAENELVLLPLKSRLPRY
jgi:hypothetical protein